MFTSHLYILNVVNNKDATMFYYNVHYLLKTIFITELQL